MFRRRLLPATAALAVFLSTFCALAQETPAKNNTTPPSSPSPEWTSIPLQPADINTTRNPSSVPQTNFPSFAACSVVELKQTVRELGQLKPVQDQSQLPSLLDKVGAKTVDIANRTPNLISHEAVVTERGKSKEHEEFSFLVVQHPFGINGHVFDEYRVDVATGEKIQTEFTDQAQSSDPSSLRNLPVSQALAGSVGPASQGFFSTWLYFYPSNRGQFEFRYLGEQEMNGRHAQVIAFAQKPALVELPTAIAYENRTYSVFMQGVAWVDASDFTILRLRLDLLSAPSAVPLRQFSVDAQFAQFSIAELTSPLWLPTQVMTTTNVSGLTLREIHTYSNYRLFRTRSKLVLK